MRYRRMGCLRFHSIVLPGLLALFALDGMPARAQDHPLAMRAEAVQRGPATTAVSAAARNVLHRMPLRFEANLGQTDDRVRFLSRGAGLTLFLTHHEMVFALPQATAGRPTRGRVDRAAGGTAVRLRLLGGNPRPEVLGEERLPGSANYFVGRDPRRWRTDVPAFARVRYRGVYPGVDLVLYGNPHQLEYDFVLAPGADPAVIRLSYEGVRSLRLNRAGDLVLGVKGGALTQRKPRIYQDEGGVRREVAGSYVLTGASRRTVAFRVADYDRSRPLVIDPVLTFSTYLGGSGSDTAYAVARDASGSLYLAGRTQSANFPATAGAVQGSLAGGAGTDAFVAKLNAAGTALTYATYLGGTDGNDEAISVAVDFAGFAYVTGWTASTDFPTASPAQGVNRGGTSDAFLTKVSAAGTALVFSTYLGGTGNDIGYGVAVDSATNPYVVGSTTSTDLAAPIAPFPGGGSNAGGRDAFIIKMSTDGSGFVHFNYLGGSGDDEAFALAVDLARGVYVTGRTASTDFPATAGALQPAAGGGGLDAFVANVNAAGDGLVYATYLGGSGAEEAWGIALDSAGAAYVAGATDSTNFPTASAYQGANNGGTADAFAAKLNAAGSSLVFSTYLGGSGEDVALGIALDASSNIYVAGYTDSPDFPTAVASFQPGFAGGASDAFVTGLNAAGTSLRFSTYLGGSGTDVANGILADGAGKAVVVGGTASGDFPTASPLQAASGGGIDAFVAKVDPAAYVAPPAGGGAGGGGSPSSLCLIATAAYGSPWEPQVMTLRVFRDRYLLSHPPGRLLVQAYYAVSPPLAAAIEDRPLLQKATRIVLAPLVLFAGAPGPSALLGVLLLAAVISGRRARRGR